MLEFQRIKLCVPEVEFTEETGPRLLETELPEVSEAEGAGAKAAVEAGGGAGGDRRRGDVLQDKSALTASLLPRTAGAAVRAGAEVPELGELCEHGKREDRHRGLRLFLGGPVVSQHFQPQTLFPLDQEFRAAPRPGLPHQTQKAGRRPPHAPLHQLPPLLHPALRPNLLPHYPRRHGYLPERSE